MGGFLNKTSAKWDSEKIHLLIEKIRRIPIKLVLCYTRFMQRDRHIWRCWARILQQWGVSSLVAAILEAAGSLTDLGAQMIYFCLPWFSWAISEEKLISLARLLEDPSNKDAFIRDLREGISH